MTKPENAFSPLAKKIASLSLPILAGQAFGLLYNLVDTWFIARIDPSDPWLVGATGLVFPLYFIIMAASFGITGGVSSLVPARSPRPSSPGWPSPR